MTDTRDDLVKSLVRLREDGERVRALIDALDYDEKLKHNSPFVGKYYKEIDRHPEQDRKCHRCFHIYGLEKDTCRFLSIEVFYYEKTYTYFSIRDNQHFDPEDESDNAVEITKGEFDLHHAAVKEKISYVIIYGVV